MRVLLTKIALVAFLVLSLFLLVLKVYQENNQKLESGVKVKSKDIKVEKLNLEKILKEQNKTLDAQYKAIASEIEDLKFSTQFKKLNHEKTLKIKKFISKCTITHEIEEKKEITKPKKTTIHTLPRVAIIMDDVSTHQQALLIKKLPFPITPSIFPSTYNHPDTPSIAKMFRHYMVHTPMEAYHFPSPEENTLNVDDDLNTIDQKIRDIKKNFPNLIAINNHTGSMFTSDYESMDKLFCTLKKYHIRFIDSRTSTDTKGRKMAEIFHTKVLERNVFLDNIDDEDAILQKIQESVDYAKKHHVVIAICHPKPTTFLALMHAKKILKGVEMVTIDKLYR